MEVKTEPLQAPATEEVLEAQVRRAQIARIALECLASEENTERRAQIARTALGDLDEANAKQYVIERVGWGCVTVRDQGVQTAHIRHW